MGTTALVRDDLFEDSCDDCLIDDLCFDRSCLTRIFIGKCSAFDRVTKEMNMAQMCLAPTANAHTPTFNDETVERTRRNLCGKTMFPVEGEASIQIDFDICSTESTMKLLMARCPIAIMFVPRIDLFDITAPQASQNLMLLRGIFMPSGETPWTNDFKDLQTTSRTWTSQGGYFGRQQWLDALPDPTPINLAQVQSISARTRDAEKNLQTARES